ncbi:MAG: carboxypeptidase regulatory-like domain-containing protein, partial [Acidobacteria bacterium]|nr:carboxypeptidase regulatory-like domain-containing protein [Acidobacteriota bacterium]
MRKFTQILMVGLALLLAQIAIQAQVNGSISGTVTDQNGAVVPGATVKVLGPGIDFTATTGEAGTYKIPAVPNGVYTVTITGQGFKTTNVRNVKVDVGTPTTVDAAMEAGAPEVTVEVTTGGE